MRSANLRGRSDARRAISYLSITVPSGSLPRQGCPESASWSRFAHRTLLPPRPLHRLVSRAPTSGHSILDAWAAGRAGARRRPQLSMIFLSSQLAGNSVLPGLPDAMAMPAAAVRVAVEYVGGPFRGDVDVLGLRPVLGINRIPPRTIRIGRLTAIISRLTRRSDPERLVVLLAATRLGRLRPPRGNIATRHLAARAGQSRRSRRQADLMPSGPPAHYVFLIIAMR